MTESKHNIIQEACVAISQGDLNAAKMTIQKKYPFTPSENTGRQYTDIQKFKVFRRDGFTDRYSGEKLIFPPVLRILSNLMPYEFPFHKNWKTTECHMLYWHLLPTIDHVVPVSRGGKDEESNWVCTSQMRNGAKANWLLEELDWQLHQPGNVDEWDGMLEWFFAYVEKNPDTLRDKYINSWHRAAVRAMST